MRNHKGMKKKKKKKQTTLHIELVNKSGKIFFSIKDWIKYYSINTYLKNVFHNAWCLLQ